MKTVVSGSRHHAGFTLLELVLAMLLLALLVGMIFSTATTNVALSNAVITKQNEESTKNAFLGLMSRQFAGLPGNTRMKLTYKDAGSAYLSDLTLQNVPLDFTWGGVQKVAKAVQLSTVQKRNGFLDIVLKYYEEEIIQDNDHPEDNPDEEPFAQVVLLEDVRVFEWQVLNGSTLEWQYDWDL
ncbi:MAG: hypothetical protein JWO82_1489, partial [Akkermansiaceae bacterium]|nr:hypothetical protein [Akkermansiaceae bacterium]